MRVDEPSGGAPRWVLRAAPTALAAVLAAGYLVATPVSADLAAQLLRVKLFDAEGFGLWNNWWYAGHDVLGYSVLFPALGALLGARLLGALAAVGAAAAFEALAHDRFGDRAWVGAGWFAAATATELLSGRLTFTLGLCAALATALALQRRRPGAAIGCAVLTALTSPVAALFAALAGAAHALAGPRRAPTGCGVVVAALGPVGLLAVAFPEAGREPFAFSALWPIPLLAAGLLLAIPATDRALRAGVLIYTAGCLLAYAVATPVGGNAARLGVLVAGPLAALLLSPDRVRLLLLAAPALVYVQWQGAIRDLSLANGNASTTTAYYRPLLAFLEHQPGSPFRVEIPFTATHWEAYEVAPRFPLARGWERQLDIGDDRLFYDRRPLTAARYEHWLHALAVRYVALPDTALDPSALAEARLIDAGLPYLRLAYSSRHWRVYAVAGASPIVSGAAALTALGPDSATLAVRHAGSALVRIRWSPYWQLVGVPGCVAPAGAFTSVALRAPGDARLVISFSAARIGSRSPRCERGLSRRR